jgi:hypothetical protein
MMPDQPALEGRAAWRAMVGEMQPTVHAITVDVAEIEGRGDLAYIRGTYSETLSFGAPTRRRCRSAGTSRWISRASTSGY